MAAFLPPYSQRHIITLGGITLLAYAAVLVVLAQPPTTSQQSAPAKRMEVNAATVQKDFEQPLALAQKGSFDTALVSSKFLMIDIRPWPDYQQAHIEGAVSTPLNQLQYALLGSVDHLVVYGQSESDLAKALEILGSMGIKQAYTLNEPLDSLKAQGYTITTQTP